MTAQPPAAKGPDLTQWLDYCQQLQADGYSNVPGITPDQAFSLESIKTLNQHLQSEYADSAAVDPEIRQAQESYLGQFAIQQLGGKWVSLNEQEHGLDGVGVFINAQAGYLVPQELWKLLFDAQGTEIVTTTLSADQG